MDLAGRSSRVLTETARAGQATVLGAGIVVGPAGVYAVPAGGRRDRAAQLRDMRAALDAAGLVALPVTATSNLDSAITLAESDLRFGPSTVRNAIAALSPEVPFVAGVAEVPVEAPAPSVVVGL